MLLVRLERVLEHKSGRVVDLESEDYLVGPRGPLVVYLT